MRFQLPDVIQGELDFALFSDGACRGNPGPGAWGSFGQNHRGEVIFEGSGVEASTTNNRMEMEGALKALKNLQSYLKGKDEGREDSVQRASVFLFSDSQYVVNGMMFWVKGWKKRGWKKSDRRTPENIDLWKQLDEAREKFWKVSFYWVRGHDGHPQNEYCDELANRALDDLA